MQALRPMLWIYYDRNYAGIICQTLPWTHLIRQKELTDFHKVRPYKTVKIGTNPESA